MTRKEKKIRKAWKVVKVRKAWKVANARKVLGFDKNWYSI